MDYQDVAYAEHYRLQVEKVRAAEVAINIIIDSVDSEIRQIIAPINTAASEPLKV